MQVQTELPHTVDETPHVWIPLSSGERLAARLWVPADAGPDRPVPAVLEYIPYRKGDYTAIRDQASHGWLAGHGLGCVRVDVRGTGDSDGLHREQWSPEYDRDAAEVLAWIAAQPWCSGRIGMMGLSWGAQAALRMASLAPPELGAVVAMSAADDRYTNKYLGGSPLLNTVVWGAAVMAQNARPPDPANVGEGWREAWRRRVEGLPCYHAGWLGHARRDAFWSEGAVIDRLPEFGCPVLVTGGLAEQGYAQTVPNLLEGLGVPVHGLLGPWGHKPPHFASPGPAVDFLPEIRAWLGQWLSGEPPRPRPALRAWMHRFARPLPFVARRAGRWIEESTWPSPNVSPHVLHLAAGALRDSPSAESDTLDVRTPQSVGSGAGEWMPWLVFGDQRELAGDQREDDGRSVTLDSEPLEAPLEVLGCPALEVDVSCDRPIAMLVARLCEVTPRGQSLRVTYGALNLTRRDGLADPTPLEPGRRYRVRVPLYVAAHEFSPGNRIRLALSTTYWPVVWPTPEVATVRVHTEGARLVLPVRAGVDAALDAADAEPVCAAPMSRTELAPPRLERETQLDTATGERRVRQLDDGGRWRIDAFDLEVAARTERVLAIRDDDPLSARAEVDWSWSYRRGPWSVRTEVRSRTTCDAESFLVDSEVRAFEGDALLVERQWREVVPRDLI
ncbi:MAG: CocE/NonD family hydrolase [Chromatiales bacterium]|nr:CocE/NonD family hydrolase [Chromatiales bacterium]